MKVQDLIHILCRLPQDTEICVCRKKVVGYLEDDELPNTANLLVLVDDKYAKRHHLDSLYKDLKKLL